jgi:TolB-like protein/Tfp pilus assembly protein PilF
MPEQSHNPFNFWQELKRRKVIRIIPVYAAAAFVLLELVDIIAEPLRLPEWTINLVLVLLCIGFVISLILSWIYDFTPEGVQKTKSLIEGQKSEKVQTSNVWKIITYLSLVVIVGLVVINMLSRHKKDDDVTRLEKSIAVLPFKSLSDDPEKQYLADGVMDAILLNLSNIKDLSVMARTSVEQYRGATKTAIEIGKELNVAYLLEASFQKYEKNVRLIVQLIKSNDGSHLWSKNYDREWKDIFSVQSEVAETVAREIYAVITPLEKQMIEKEPTLNLEAYEFYLKGLSLLNKRTGGNLIQAIEFFNLAIEKDHSFAQAYVGLANCYNLISFYEDWIPSEAFPEARLNAEKALELDNTLAEAYASLAYVKHRYDWDLIGAEEDFLKAIELNQNNALTYQWYAEFLWFSGRYEEALIPMNEAIKLDPLSLVLNCAFGQVLARVNKVEEAIKHLENIIELNPEFGYAYFMLGYVLLSGGYHSESIDYLKKSVEMSNNAQLFMATLGIAYAKSGDFDEVQELQEKLNTLSEKQYILSFTKAVLLSELGEQEEALHWLYKAIDEKTDWLLFIRHEKMFFTNLREDQRFIDVLNKIDKLND